MTLSLSIVIAAAEPVPVIHECLAALAPQCDGETEVIVATGAADGSDAELAARHPWIRVLRVPHARALPALRGAGMAESRADVIGILDAWCLAGPNWVAAARREHAGPQAPVVGGAVLLDQRQARSLAAWATYLFDYWEFVAPPRDGEVTVLPGNNITYDRAVLPDRDTLRRDGFWKAFTNARLLASGQALRAASDLTVRLRRPVHVGAFLRSRYHHGRSYAAMRVRGQGPFERLKRATLTPALPLVFLARQARGLWDKRAARAWFLLSLPLMLAFHLSWSWGELHGYLAGAGRSDDEIRS